MRLLLCAQFVSKSTYIYICGVICGFAYLGVLCIAFIALYINFDRLVLVCTSWCRSVLVSASEKVWDFGIPATFRRSFTAAHPSRTAGWYQRRIKYTGYTPLSRQEGAVFFKKILQYSLAYIELTHARYLNTKLCSCILLKERAIVRF